MRGIRRQWSDDNYEEVLYTFYELDNLEYSTHKYKLGYMSAYVAHRSLHTFSAKCAGSRFRDLAQQLAHTLSYDDETKAVVDHVCQEEMARAAANEAAAREASSGRSSGA